MQANQHGTTLVELLVGIALSSVVGFSILTFMFDVLHTVGNEGRVSMAAMELRNALAMLSSELRNGSSISPYLVGDTPQNVNCANLVSVTSTTIKFLVAEDDSASSTLGVKPYYVGYKYDAATKRLLRGEIAGTVTTACTLPAGDPLASSTAKTLAENVNQIDADGNGTLDPVFSLAGSQLTVNLGVSINLGDARTASQKMTTKIYMRVH